MYMRDESERANTTYSYGIRRQVTGRTGEVWWRGVVVLSSVERKRECTVGGGYITVCHAAEPRIFDGARHPGEVAEASA